MLCTSTQLIIIPITVTITVIVSRLGDLSLEIISSKTIIILAKQVTRILIKTKNLLPSSLLAFTSISVTGSLKKIIQLEVINEAANTSQRMVAINTPLSWLLRMKKKTSSARPRLNKTRCSGCMCKIILLVLLPPKVFAMYNTILGKVHTIKNFRAIFYYSKLS